MKMKESMTNEMIGKGKKDVKGKKKKKSKHTQRRSRRNRPHRIIPVPKRGGNGEFSFIPNAHI